MDLNRQKSSLENRKWDKYSTDTNVKYLKKKLKEYGLNIPKYLKEKKLSLSNINSLTKRLISSIDKQREEARRRPTPVTDINEQQALKELQKAIDKHNRTVIKKISKITHLSDTKQNFLFGNSVRVGSKKSYQYRNEIFRVDTQFTTYSLDDMHFSDVASIINFTKKIKGITKRLTNENIKKELRFSSVAVASIQSLLQGYHTDGYLTSEEYSYLMRIVKKMDGVEQEMLQQLFSASGLKVKYIIPDEELTDFKSNLFNKLVKLVEMVKSE